MKILLAAALMLLTTGGSAQEIEQLLPLSPPPPVECPAEAEQLFEQERYAEAAAMLRGFLAENPANGRAHFLLGYSLHRLNYDSLPVDQEAIALSDQALRHLERAMTLLPGDGQPVIVLGREYGARAWERLRRKHIKQLGSELRWAFGSGAFPAWLLEYGRNLLRSCAEDAILFTGGDDDTHPLVYLQQVRGLRPDVCVIPLALLDRPWFLRALEKGLVPGSGEGIASLSSRQRDDVHPSRWTARPYTLPGGDPPFEITIEPTLQAGDRGFLRVRDQALLKLITANDWQRPLQFSVAIASRELLGLDPLLRLDGLAWTLLPVPPEQRLEASLVEKVLDDEKAYGDLPSLEARNYGKAAGILNNYRVALLNLAAWRLERGQKRACLRLIDRMDEAVPPELLALPIHLGKYRNHLRDAAADTESFQLDRP